MGALALDQGEMAESTSADIPKGYHITDIGVLPTDWQVSLLPQVCRFRGGKAHEKFISSSGAYACVNSKFISSDGKVVKFSSENHCAAKTGDILMVMSDLPNGKALAKAFVADRDNFYAVNQRVCALTPYRDSSLYLFYALNRHPYFLKFDDGVNQTHLLNPVFNKCPVALPPSREEQQAIAEALSDADALVEGLEKLIAKKRLIKQGAMQELLTGKRRLPGFSREWKEKSIGDLAIIDPENLSSQTSPDYTFNYIALEDVHEGSLYGFTERTYGSAPSRARRRLRCGDVLVATVRPNLKSHLFFTTEGGEWVCSTGFSVLRCRPEFSESGFIFAHLFGDTIARQIEMLISGSNYPAINSRDVAALRISCPLPEEQAAISTVLSEMEAELVALEAKLSKARQIKQGMMQELLTGRIRLV